jgi:hypothetical protein
MPRGKAKQLTESDLIKREQSRRESAAEFERLKEHWPELRQALAPEAVLAMWILLGDAIFVKEQHNGATTKGAD